MRWQHGNAIAMRWQRVGNALEHIGNTLSTRLQHIETRWLRIDNGLVTCWQCVGNMFATRWQHISKALATYCQRVGNTLATRWQCC